MYIHMYVVRICRYKIKDAWVKVVDITPSV